MKTDNNLQPISWFGLFLNQSWQSLNSLKDYNKFLPKLLAAEIEEPLSMQMLEQSSDYQSYEEWRSAIQRNLKQVIHAIRKPVGIAPGVLKDALIAQQECISIGFSPLDYELYFQKLEYNLENKYQLPKGYVYALKEARVRLRQKLEQRLDLAVLYFYHDVINHVLRASTYFVAPKNLLNALSYYKNLIPDSCYTAVLAELNYQTSNPTNAYYKQLFQKINKAYESISKIANHRIRQTLKYAHAPSNCVILSSLLASASLFMLSYQYATSNFLTVNPLISLSTGKLLFNIPFSVLSSALINYELTHARYSMQNAINLLDFANLLSSLSVVTAQTTSPTYDTFIKEFDVSDNPQYPYTQVSLDRNLAIIVTPDNSFSNFAFSSLATILVTKFSSGGALLQTDSIGLENIEDSTYLDVQNLVKTTDGGMAIAAGSSMMKYSSNNLMEWAYERTNNEYPGNVYFATKVLATSDDAIITAGGQDYFIAVKFSNGGAILWQNRLHFQEYSIFNGEAAITTTTDSNVVVGSVANKPMDSAYYVFSPTVVKINNSNGAVMWVRIINGIHNGYLDDITSTQDNSVIAVGRYMDPSTPPGWAICPYAWIAKVSGNGELLWSKSIYPMDDFDDYDSLGPTAVVSSPDDNVVFAGFWAKTYLMKYQSVDGSLLWSKSIEVDKMYVNTKGSLTFMLDGSLLIASPAYMNSKDGFFVAKLTADATLPSCNNMRSVSIPVSNLTLNLSAPIVDNGSPTFTIVSIDEHSMPINVKELGSICNTSSLSPLSEKLIIIMITGGGTLVLMGGFTAITCHLYKKKKAYVENISIENVTPELSEKSSLIEKKQAIKTFESTLNKGIVPILHKYSIIAQDNKNNENTTSYSSVERNTYQQPSLQ